MSLKNYIASFLFFILMNKGIIFAEKINNDCDLEGTELLMAFLVHRHGDRTPLEQTVSLSDNPKLVRIFTNAYGYGQLTEAGKRRAYAVGQFIRNRYNRLLSSRYNSSEIYIRSTDVTRAQMTVLTAMAAVYRSYPGSWSKSIDWVPVPYTTVPENYDFNSAMSNCPTYMDFMNKTFFTDNSDMAEYVNLLNQIADITGINMTTNPVLMYALFDVYTSQINLGIPLRPELDALYPQMQEAADKAIDIVFGNDNYIRLQAGVLLNEFFEAASLVMAGENTPRVRIYSGHDFNVYSFEAVTQVTPRQGVPKYGSIFSLELRRVVDTGQYVILPVYVDSPEEQPEYLQVKDCDNLLCDMDTFRNVTSKYVLNVADWRRECNFTDLGEALIDYAGGAGGAAHMFIL